MRQNVTIKNRVVMDTISLGLTGLFLGISLGSTALMKFFRAALPAVGKPVHPFSFLKNISVWLIVLSLCQTWHLG